MSLERISRDVAELQNEKLRRQLEEEKRLNASLRAECEELQNECDLWPAKERLAFARGAEAMRRLCIFEFNLSVALLQKRRSRPKQALSAAGELRLRAEIADQKHSAGIISKLPLPSFKPQDEEARGECDD